MKKILIVLIIAIVIIIPIVFTILKMNSNKEESVKAQIIEFNAMDRNFKVVKEINVSAGDTINLDKYNGNEIKILEITEEYIKISRDVVRYEIVKQTSSVSGETRKYTETLIETVDYEDSINIDIDEQDPFGPIKCQALYSYTIKFVKQ